MGEDIDLVKLVEDLRSYKGFTRKSILSDILNIFGDTSCEDAGIIGLGNSRYVVVSTDGITEELVKADCWLAGFYSVVVNVNDVVAKGAKPIGYANVIASSSAERRRLMAEGAKEAMDKYRLVLLKGHTHPDTTYDAIDACVVGVCDKFIPVDGAKPGDSLVVAIDLEGTFGCPAWVRCFDSVMNKSPEEITRRIDGMIALAKSDLATASRDISAPGIVGSIAMLCEPSGVGAEVWLDEIPSPRGVGLGEWLLSYPGMGFVIATQKPRECVELLEEHGFAAKTVGQATKDLRVVLRLEERAAVFIDLQTESVFGFRRVGRT